MERERQAADRHAECSHAGLMDGGMVGDGGRDRQAERSIDFPG